MPRGLRSFFLLALLAPVFGHAADPVAGEKLYATCAACHGMAGEGNDALDSPAIAGQSTTYLTRQLDSFRNGLRGAAAGDTGGAQMRPMAATLADDAAIANVVAYVATLPEPMHAATVNGDAENGSKQFISKCGACHGGKGEGNDALNSPRLTILSNDHLVMQVQKFQSGLRGAHIDDKYGRQMAMMSTLVSEQELADVVAFLNEIAQQP
jgi:cytochrome c553